MSDPSQNAEQKLCKAVQLLSQALIQALTDALDTELEVEGLQEGQSRFAFHLQEALPALPDMAGDYLKNMRQVLAEANEALNLYEKREGVFYGG